MPFGELKSEIIGVLRAIAFLELLKINEEDREVEIKFENNKIIIKKLESERKI